MSKIQARLDLTDTEVTQLIQLINPLADFSRPKVGACDTNESASVVQCVKFSKTLTAPAGVTGNWDAHVFTLPVCNSIFQAQPGRSLGGLCISPNGGVIDSTKCYGGVTAITAASNVSTPGLSIYNGITEPGVTISSDGLCPSFDQADRGKPAYISGCSRIIGMGFEVHNTTAPIDASGSVAVYRYPQTANLDRMTQTFVGAATGSISAPTSLRNYGTITTYPIVDVPASLEQAMLLEGTQQWEAKDGCMVIPTLNSQTLDVMRLETIVPQIRTGVYETVTVPSGGGDLNDISMEYVVASAFGSASIPPVDISVPPSQLQFYPSAKYNPFNTSGAMFTGLKNSSTLVVNTVWYIERFPTMFDADLVVLANPSPPYSPLVMPLYTALMRDLPVGVKVSDNADGDWFYEAISSLADFLGPSLTAVPGFGPALSAGAQAIGGMAKKKVKDNQKAAKAPKKDAPSTWVVQKPASKKDGGWETTSGMHGDPNRKKQNPQKKKKKKK